MKTGISRLLAIGICILASLPAMAAQTTGEDPSVSMALFADQQYTNADASYLYTKSLGGGVELAIDSADLKLLAKLDMHTADANNVWTDLYTILSASTGLGYTFYNSSGHQLTATCRYGVVAHYNGTKWYLNQQGAAGLRLSSQISSHIRPFLEAGVTLLFASPANTLLFNGTAGIQYTYQ